MAVNAFRTDILPKRSGGCLYTCVLPFKVFVTDALVYHACYLCAIFWYFQVLVAVFPGRTGGRQSNAGEFVATQMNYFDVETNEWKCIPSMATLIEATACFCAEYVGNYLYVAKKKSLHSGAIYRYHSVNNGYFQSSHSYASGISFCR